MSICKQKHGPPFYIVVHCKNAVEMQFTGMQTNSFVDCHLKAIAQPQAVITSHSVLECQPAILCEARPLLSVTNNATCYGAKGRLWSGSSIRITASYIRIADEDHVSRLWASWIWTVPWFVHNIKGSWSFVLASKKGFSCCLCCSAITPFLRSFNYPTFVRVKEAANLSITSIT